MKKLAAALALASLALLVAAGPTLIDLAANTKGLLPQAKGGTGVSGSATYPSAGVVTVTVAFGTVSLTQSPISTGACSSAQTLSATGVLSTDVARPGFNGDPTGATGFTPSTSGMLTVVMWPSVDAVNFKTCNNTTGTITPEAITLNWQVTR